MTCKRIWAIECSELEAALMKSFHQMGVNSWKGKTAGRNTRDPRPWDKLLTKEIETAGKCQICSSFKEDRQLLTTLVQRTEWLPKKSKGYEPWNIDSISKTDPLLSAAFTGNCAISGISLDAGLLVAGGLFHADPTQPCRREQHCQHGCCSTVPLVTLGTGGWDMGWWEGRCLCSHCCVAGQELVQNAFVFWRGIVILSIFELIFHAKQVHLLSANGSISFIVTLFPIFKLMLPRELKGNPVHLVSG